ncbi:MAG: AAA family ATPase [Acidobacteria bacterium]|nr:AAA family ATPase [Acidobacteriota bacterium]MBI3471182.1 AAA family ATPase [Candidatus Solibacter usitatus]
MPTIGEVRPAFCPAPPQKLEDLGVSQTLLTDLMLRRLSIEGTSNLSGLSGALKISLPVVDTLFRATRNQQLVEVKGMLGNDYWITLSGAGRQLATERFHLCHYAGAAPVSLKEYHAATKAQAAEVDINRRVLRNALSDLVVTDDILDKLGPAIISQTSVFLYGPTGNGKTSLAERLLRVYHDAILMPYAVEVDGQIIALYDPVVHHRIEVEDQEIDPRWVLCRRPCILVGGELVPGMVELRLDEASGIYSAPLQMKANNGIFIIDDFGRQLISPRDLLNRWIVPLDRRVDYLSLRYGVKFQIPFEVMVVFATNLDPNDLADEAFLRRIHNKIYIEPVTAQTFDEIFKRVATARNIPLEPDSCDILRKLCLTDGRTELRACYPMDMCNILSSIGRYEKRPVTVTRKDMERAVALYFTKA